MSKSRPKRTQPPPATPASSAASAANGWCISCGRLLPVETKVSTTPRKYCSSTCRSHGRSTSLTQSRLLLAKTYHELLSSRPSNSVVLCSEAESFIAASSTSSVEDEAKASKSNQREEARRAARRLVNFGFESQGVQQETRAVDAVQNGLVVESSFAKSEWGIRWR